MVSYLQTIIVCLEEFFLHTGVTVTLFDLCGNCIAHRGGGKMFCRIIRSNADLCEKCNKCDKHARKCAGAVYETKCPMRIREVTVPVYYRGECAGYLMMGKCFVKGDKKRACATVRKRAVKFEFDCDRALAELNNLPVLTEDAYHNAVAFLIKTAEKLGNENCLECLLDPRVQQAIGLIADFDGEKMTCPRLCKAMGMGRHALERLIRQKCGERLADFIAERILIQLEDRLMNSDQSVRSLSLDIGYNYRSFIGLFKRRCGLTPPKFRTCEYAEYRNASSRRAVAPPF